MAKHRVESILLVQGHNNDIRINSSCRVVHSPQGLDQLGGAIRMPRAKLEHPRMMTKKVCFQSNTLSREQAFGEETTPSIPDANRAHSGFMAFGEADKAATNFNGRESQALEAHGHGQEDSFGKAVQNVLVRQERLPGFAHGPSELIMSDTHGTRSNEFSQPGASNPFKVLIRWEGKWRRRGLSGMKTPETI
jgi:hypothetical protein